MNELQEVNFDEGTFWSYYGTIEAKVNGIDIVKACSDNDCINDTIKALEKKIKDLEECVRSMKRDIENSRLTGSKVGRCHLLPSIRPHVRPPGFNDWIMRHEKELKIKLG